MEQNQNVNQSEVSLQVFGSKENFENAQRMATVLCSSEIVPQIYRGKEKLANCIIALEMANRIQASPLMVMQNLYMVRGEPGWSSKFLIAALNSCGRFAPLRYEFKGEEGKDDWGCRAWTTDKKGEILHGAWVTIAMAKKEGWYQKSGSKWQTMPQLMLQYRSAAFFQRVYAPEISMGMHTVEEIKEITIDTDFEDVTEKLHLEKETNANKGEAISIEETPEQKKPEKVAAKKPEKAVEQKQQQIDELEEPEPNWMS